MRLQSKTSKDLTAILTKAAELHDGIPTLTDEQKIELIEEIVPFIEQAMGELEYLVVAAPRPKRQAKEKKSPTL